MARSRGAEELRFFDFSEVLRGVPGSDGEDGAATGEGGVADQEAKRADGAKRAEAVATALRRRVEEVSQIARTPAGGPEPSDEAWAREVEEAEEAADEVDEGEETLSIAAFYNRVRSALARAFPAEVWVSGEIRGLRESRGHRYLELADHDAGQRSGGPGTVNQQLEVVCWAKEWPRVAASLYEAGVDLEVGRVVRVRGRVQVWEGGSRLRFVLRSIDIEALLGGIAAARHKLLQALAQEGLLEANRRLPLCLVPLRIGLVTSRGSEAQRDFLGRLERSGFAFQVRHEQSLVQGPEAPRQIAAALGRLASFSPDLAVIVRGGGARGDLAAFDAEVVARAIATAPFPVWTGIGHTGDRSVADEVAQRSCITPTACGEAVVAVVAAYRELVAKQAVELARLARARLEGSFHQLEGRRAAVVRGVRHQLGRRADALGGTRDALARYAVTGLDREADRLAASALAATAGVRRRFEREEREHLRCSQLLRAYDPRRQLERGWSLTHDEAGALVRTVAGLAPGHRLVTRLADGEVRSVVESLEAATRPEPAHEPGPEEAGGPGSAAGSGAGRTA